jgi:hypothetical protein
MGNSDFGGIDSATLLAQPPDRRRIFSQVSKIAASAYPASLAANASTSAPTIIRYTANGAKPRLRT